MAGWPLRTVLIRRWMRFWIADLWSESIAPLTDANARLNYTAVATLMFLLLPRRSEERLLGQAVSLPEAAEAILYAFPAFLMLNAVFAIFRVSRAGRQLGTWFGPKYVYNEPKQVATLLVDASRQGQAHSLKIPDVENGSFVAHRVDIDRSDERVKVQLEYQGCPATLDWRMVSKATRRTSRLPKSRTLDLITHIEPESTATTIRVFVLGFEIGKGAR